MAKDKLARVKKIKKMLLRGELIDRKDFEFAKKYYYLFNDIKFEKKK